MANNFLNKIYDFGVSIAEDPNNINNTGEFVLDTLKGIKSGVEQTARDLGLISEPIPSNSIVSDKRRPWEKASDEIKDYINVLTNENRIGHQQAVQDLVFDLITAYGGGSAGAKAVQMAKPIVSEALNVLRSKGIRAFENFMNNKIGQIKYNKVKNIEDKEIVNTTNDLTYKTSKTKNLKNNKTEYKTEVYKNNQKVGEFDYVLNKNNNTINIKDQWVVEDLQGKGVGTSTINEIKNIHNTNKIGAGLKTESGEKFLTSLSNKGLIERVNIDMNDLDEIDEALNSSLIRSQEYKQASEQFKNYVQNFIKTNKKDTSKLSKEEQKLWNLVEKNKEELSKLAQSVGVTSKDEIPKLLKFAKQMNEILKNAPANIKAIVSKSAPVTLGATGLSVYDLYQEFKSGGDNLLPTVVRDASGIASTLLPGGPIAKILYAGLGYVGGDRLTRAAYKKLGLNYENNNMKAEYETGMAYPQLYEFVPEYQTGMSGRKYHVVGDRIYAFDTGKAVNVNQAIEDINQKLAYDDQQILDKTRQVENQINDIQQAIASGYEVPQETVQSVYKQYQDLQNAVAQGGTRYNITDYDIEKDLVEQVQAEQTQQPQTAQSNQGLFEQSLVDMVLNPPKRARINQEQLYKDLFNKIAQQTYDALDNYYSPEGMAIAYNDYQRNTLLGRNLGLTQDQFIKAKKLEAMQQLAPQIQKTAQTLVEKAETENIGPDADTIIKLLEWNVKRTNANETIRNNYANNLINSYKAEETARHNVAGENIDLAKLNETQRSNLVKENIDQYNALSSRMNALTNQQEAKIKQDLVPYQQSNYLGQFLINSSMTDLPMDQILNSNPQLFSKVLPGTATNNHTQINLKPYKQIQTNGNFNIGGNK